MLNFNFTDEIMFARKLWKFHDKNVQKKALVEKIFVWGKRIGGSGLEQFQTYPPGGKVAYRCAQM